MFRPWLLLVTVPIVVPWTVRAVEAEKPPNVVLILADDLGGVDLGCQGSRFYRTPNIDRLAAQGRRFSTAYAASPVCSPTRAAIMSGKHPARLNLTDWLPGRPDRPDQKLKRPEIRQALPLEETTLAEAFKAAGHVTGHIGKWHLGGEGFGPLAQGFDINVAGDERGSPPGYFAPYRSRSRPLAGLETAKEGEYLTDRLAAEAVAFIEKHKAQPFFLYLPHFAVHTPLQAREDLKARYPAWDGKPLGRQENPIYAAMVESLDDAVGRVLKTLDSEGLTDRTIVVFTSDNGGLATLEGPNTPATSNAPLREGKGWLYEGGIRVPMIVRWPGKIAPGVEATPVWSADLYPTLLALCGLTPPSATDGVNLAGLLTTGTPLEPRFLAWHYPHYSNQGGRPGGAIREGDFKLIEDYATGRRELFQTRDAGESRNLAEARPEEVARLAEKLDAWRRSVGARMPEPNPNYRLDTQGPNGGVTLAARTAEVHGVMLRYEPLPHKNTLGYWVRAEDWASWDFEIREPGEFLVEALVGCGEGSGGSVVEFAFGPQSLSLKVPVTGGFQAFQPQSLGRVRFDEPGRQRLEVRARAKPGVAVMDLRQVKLVPAPG